MIKARGLTKRYGDKLAVNQLTFTVEPGRITGFLGPNGAGKTTAMRLKFGLDRLRAILRHTAGAITAAIGLLFRAVHPGQLPAGQLARPREQVDAGDRGQPGLGHNGAGPAYVLGLARVRGPRQLRGHRDRGWAAAVPHPRRLATAVLRNGLRGNGR